MMFGSSMRYVVIVAGLDFFFSALNPSTTSEVVWVAEFHRREWWDLILHQFIWRISQFS